MTFYVRKIKQEAYSVITQRNKSIYLPINENDKNAFIFLRAEMAQIIEFP